MRHALETHAVRDQPIVIAVSGGADSVALLRILSELQDPLALRPIVAHFDHRLRDDSAEDGRWVNSLASGLGAECILGVAQTTAPSTGVEAWARRERYAFLQTCASRKNVRWIAVAHSADDQAETVLHHLIRGTGLRGLAGMPTVRTLSSTARLIRPGLGVSRAAFREYLLGLGQSFREDPSNTDGRYTRNAIRNEAIPFLRDRFGRDPSRSLVKLSVQAHEAASVLQRLARRALKRAVLEQTPDRVHIASQAFYGVPDAVVQEAGVLLWRRQKWPRREMSQGAWKRAARFLRGTTQAEQWPGGVRGVKRGGLVVLERS
ncbi:tRNA lysidine(34) synthetase TilS [Caulifigura coniformis]|uniref:tRNA lysidine(34) synthetase TilS n=1 Tax=Caulifigura coniformis TaxID=2527983 RepID=UPI0018D2581A|nr:tRNA lysidine(34) synthetase TilS [Caulifigura coniformis]